MKDKEMIEDILNKMEFFGGQRAGRELWFDKPKEVQDQDIVNFVKDINFIRSYLKDSVVLSREEQTYLEIHYYQEGIKYARKETVEKFAKALKDKYGKSASEYYPMLITLTSEDLEELAKQFGVEIKE